MTLLARTRPLAPREVPDLLHVAARGGLLFSHGDAGVAGQGEAGRIRLPGGLAGGAGAVSEALAAVAVDDPVQRPGTGPIAIGALPFTGHAAGELVIPELVVGRGSDGSGWVTVVGPPPVPEPTAATVRTALARVARSRDVAPDGFTLTAAVPHEKFLALVGDAIDAIGRGRLAKVVVAREVTVTTNRPIPVEQVLERLRALYPATHLFSVDGFVGASPELLVARQGATVRSHPLAGTFAHSGDPAVDAQAAARLHGSPKDRWEHRLVVEAVAEGLQGWCDELTVPDAPAILPLRNVMHLGTDITGRLRPGAPTALELAAALHPTPAVGGTPREEAVAWLEAYEGLERGRYAGPVGWVDSRGDGEWAVGIRSAEIEGTTARLFAGVGIVSGSVPEAELAETQLKLQALLAAVVRP